MNWEQKFVALKSLTSTNLEMRKPGDWYVSAYGREVVDGTSLRGMFGSGKTPEEAINNDWEKITNVAEIRVPNGRFKWSGFMWEKL